MKQRLLSVVVLVWTVSGSECRIQKADSITQDDAMNYLTQFGYAGSSVPDSKLRDLANSDPAGAYKLGLKLFQARNRAYGLSVTGELDEPTRKLMSRERCGVKDIRTREDIPGLDGLQDVSANKRYVIGGNRWPQNDLTYRIINYTPDLSQSEVDSEISRAFKVWSDVSPLTFTEVAAGAADIYISFVSGDHNDGSPFDGQGGVLAHAYYPLYGNDIEGDAHFDEAETWTIATYSGINLFQVAIHEIGHSLGLGHSTFTDALMAPYYRGYVPDFELHSDDIAGIQAMYGSPTAPDFCDDSSIDAITSHMSYNGVLSNYAFKGDYYVKLSNIGISFGYPAKISDDWPGITNGIDAALYLEAWRDVPAYTLLFKDNRYYVFNENKTLIYDKKLASLGLPNDLTTIDAAFVWESTGRIYIMKGSEYYILKRKNKATKVLKGVNGNPRDLSWWNLPVTSIDAAVTSYGVTYFFKDQSYYRINNDPVQVFDATPSYPRNTGEWWFGCDSNIAAAKLLFNNRKLFKGFQN